MEASVVHTSNQYPYYTIMNKFLRAVSSNFKSNFEILFI